MVTLTDAANICRPLDQNTFRQRGPQDATLDLADELIGAENLKNAKLEADANVDGVFRSNAYTLETCAINLRAYSRGMVSKETLPTYIRQAREALDAMEAAVSQ